MIEAGAILQLDDVHSAHSVKVLPNELVSVDEHGNQEAEQEHVEKVNKDTDEDFSLWELIYIKVLLSVETVEDVQYDLEE